MDRSGTVTQTLPTPLIYLTSLHCSPREHTFPSLGREWPRAVKQASNPEGSITFPIDSSQKILQRYNLTSSVWGPDFSLTDELIFLNMMTAQSGFPEGKRLGYTKIGANVRRIRGEGQQSNRAALLTSEPGAANSRSHGQSAQCAHNSILTSTPARDRLCFQARKRLVPALKQGTSCLSMLCSVANYLTSPALWVPLCLGH